MPSASIICTPLSRGSPAWRPSRRLTPSARIIWPCTGFSTDRLRAPGIIGIPESRFATVVDNKSAPLKGRPTYDEMAAAGRPPYVGRPFRGANFPAIFQQRIPGATLWDMFDFAALRILPAWQPFKATIASHLSALLDSSLVDHVDWNIKNFVFHGAEQRLYYVDSKPTIYVARSSNDQNLSGIRTHFVA